MQSKMLHKGKDVAPKQEAGQGSCCCHEPVAKHRKALNQLRVECTGKGTVTLTATATVTEEVKPKLKHSKVPLFIHKTSRCLCKFQFCRRLRRGQPFGATLASWLHVVRHVDKTSLGTAPSHPPSHGMLQTIFDLYASPKNNKRSCRGRQGQGQVIYEKQRESAWKPGQSSVFRPRNGPTYHTCTHAHKDT